MLLLFSIFTAIVSPAATATVCVPSTQDVDAAAIVQVTVVAVPFLKSHVSPHAAN